MKRTAKYLVLSLLALSLLSWGKGYTQTSVSEDKTLSPYFFVKSDDPAVDQLPLKATSATVDISGVIADVRVKQVYKNEGKKALEAIYVFPASTRAAVYGMKMTIGKRVIEANIKKREEARREYEQAREQGKSASLLEQQRPNVFQMNVANIMPGDEIVVELKYTELIVPNDRVYEFAYPTVVGPRYSNQPAATAPASETWVQNPFTRQGELPTYGFDIQVKINAGLPISRISCDSHKTKVDYQGTSAALVTLDPAESFGGNRDYILRYRLDGDRIQSGLLLYEGEKENFFLLMMQPPKKVEKADIPGREYIFIVDVSGSMYGFPLEISKKLLTNLIGGLRPTDRFNVLLFSGGSSLMAEESLPATRENIDGAIQVIERQRGGGGTELLPALKRALDLKKPDNFSRTVVIVTDGYVTVEEEVFDLIRKSLGDANMFAFGIGTSVNRHIIEGMAHVGMGEPFVIVKPDEAPAKAERFRAMIASPVLTKVKVAFKGFDAYDVEPLSIPDVLADRPVIVFGKWRGKPEGSISMTGVSGHGKYKQTIDVEEVKPEKGNAALRYLWARHRITILSDYNKLRSDDKRIGEVTDLGLNYNLLTAYTSFVAVDSEIRNVDGKSTTVKQPLPLPQGVSDYAVGYAVGANGTAKMYAPSPMAMRESTGVKYDHSSVKKKTKGGGTYYDKKEAASLKVENVAVTKGLNKENVIKVVKSHLAEVEDCISGTGQGQKLVVRLTVKADGTVSEVKILSGKGIDELSRTCLENLMKKWQFTAAKGKYEMKATITFTT
jgi:Ca-activated chloride channel homolog